MKRFLLSSVLLLAGFTNFGIANATDLPDLVIDSATCQEPWLNADGNVDQELSKEWGVFEKMEIMYPSSQCAHCSGDERDIARQREEASETYFTCEVVVRNQGDGPVPPGYQGYLTFQVGDLLTLGKAFLLPTLVPGETTSTSSTFQFAYFFYGEPGVNSYPVTIEVNRYADGVAPTRRGYLARFHSMLRDFYNVSQDGTDRQVPESDRTNNFFTTILQLPFANRPTMVNMDSTKLKRVGDDLHITWESLANVKRYQIYAVYGAGEVEATLHKFESTEPSLLLPRVKDGERVSLTIYGINDYGAGPHAERDYYIAANNPFIDVANGSWYEEFVKELFVRNIIEGYRNGNGEPTGRFGPGDNVTVAELGQIYVRMRGIPLSDDVSQVPERFRQHWSSKVLAWLIRQNFWLVQYDKSPDRHATREEVVRFILENDYDLIGSRAFYETPAAKEMLNYTLPDIDTENKFYTQMAYDFGIIDGYPDGYFRPKNLVNRAEVAKILLNAGRSELR